MSNIYVHETYINKDKNAIFGDSGDQPYESFTDSIGRLFRSCQREYGRCTSAMYNDSVAGTTRIGWVFEKRMAYEDDAKDFYMREVWVSLHEAPDTIKRTRHYIDLDKRSKVA